MTKILCTLMLGFGLSLSYAQDNLVKIGLGMGGQTLDITNDLASEVNFGEYNGISFHGFYEKQNGPWSKMIGFEYQASQYDLDGRNNYLYPHGYFFPIEKIDRTALQTLNLSVGTSRSLVASNSYRLQLSGSLVGSWMYDYNVRTTYDDGHELHEVLETGPMIGGELALRNYIAITDVSDLVINIVYSMSYGRSFYQMYTTRLIEESEQDAFLRAINVKVSYALVL